MNLELKELEQTGKYLFHGSVQGNIHEFEPRQAYTWITGKKEPDGEPAVFASEFADIAVHKALINSSNIHGHFYSSFYNDEAGRIRHGASEETIRQLVDPRGYVYVFDKTSFQKRHIIDWVCFQAIRPIKVIAVDKTDLPKLEIIEDTTK